jgi:hypothetical protein
MLGTSSPASKRRRELVLYEAAAVQELPRWAPSRAPGNGRDRYASGQSNGKLVPKESGHGSLSGKQSDYMPQMARRPALRMGYAGARTLAEHRSARMVPITSAASRGHPHSIVITKEAPNYQKRMSRPYAQPGAMKG